MEPQQELAVFRHDAVDHRVAATVPDDVSLDVEPQVRLAGRGVGPVAGEAVLREDRTDLTGKIRGRPLDLNRGQHCEQEHHGVHPTNRHLTSLSRIFPGVPPMLRSGNDPHGPPSSPMGAELRFDERSIVPQAAYGRSARDCLTRTAPTLSHRHACSLMTPVIQPRWIAGFSHGRAQVTRTKTEARGPRRAAATQRPPRRGQGAPGLIPARHLEGSVVDLPWQGSVLLPIARCRSSFPSSS